MSKRSTPNGALVAVILAAAVGIAAFRKRPIKPPERSGTWHPAESQRTTRR
jgi:hypothetical protein